MAAEEPTPAEGDDPAPSPIEADDRRELRKDMLAGLALCAMVLIWALLGPAWLTTENIKDGPTRGLRESCSDGDCKVSDDHQEMADTCVTLLESFDANESSIEKACGDSQDTALAGWVGSGFLGMGVLLLLGGALVCAFRRNIESGDLAPWLGLAGGVTSLIGVLAWWLLLPETDVKMDFGMHLWGVLIASPIAMGIGLLHSPLFGGRGTGFLLVMAGRLVNSGPERRRGEGDAVRAAMGTEADVQEFILREAEHGQSSSSLVLDADLLRLSMTRRSALGHLTVEDRLVLRLPALQGFSHHRLDWLDDFRFIWWGMAAAGLACIVLGIGAGAGLLGLGLIFSVLQWADPEVIIFETASGRHRKLIWRLGSNLELTAASMDHLDTAMQGLLRDGELDASKVDALTSDIDERLTAKLAAKEEILARQAQARIEVNARKEAARLAKAEEKAERKAAQEVALIAAQAELASQQEAQATAQAEALAEAQAQAQAQAQPAAAPTPTPVPTTASPIEPATTPSLVPTSVPASAPAAMAASLPPPVAPTPAPMAIPPPPGLLSPAPPAAAPVPPVLNPPSLASTPPPMEPAAIPPPPMPTPMPAPMSAPLPPPGLNMEMGMPTETVTPAPEVHMEAAPRDESLSDGEKANLMDELND